MLRIATATVLALFALPGLLAQEQADRPSTIAQRLMAEERARIAVERALELYRKPVSAAGQKNARLREAVESLLPLGAAVVPPLAQELSQGQPYSFFVAGYALGLLGTDEARDALREAIAAAERENSDFAAIRKGWAAYYLAIAGDLEAVDRLTAGRHVSVGVPIFKQASAVEAIGLLLGPPACPRLEKALAAIDDEADPRFSQRGQIVLAIGRTGDAAAVASLVRVLEEGHPRLRKKAAIALRYTSAEKTIPTLLDASADGDLNVRRAATDSLSVVGVPDERAGDVIKLLAEERDSAARIGLYKTLGRIGGPKSIEALAEAWGRPESLDRMSLTRALRSIASPAALPTLRKALIDPTPSVSIAAVQAVAAIGTDESRVLLEEVLGRPAWPVAQVAVRSIVERQYRESAPAIGQRLLTRELAGVVSDPLIRDRVEILVSALIDLGDASRLDDLRIAARRQQDPALTRFLHGALERMATLETNGDEPERWLEALDSDDPQVRNLAYPALARLGRAELAEPLAERFGRVAPDEAVHLLTALGSLDAPASRVLIRRVLTDSSFDRFEMQSLRDAAAWSARRLGGEEMVQALADSARRRHGIDVATLIYLGILAPDRGATLIRELRRERTVRFDTTRFAELVALELIVREQAAGRRVLDHDLPPERLNFR